MVLHKYVYDDLAENPDQYVRELFNERSNVKTFYEQCGIDREIISRLGFQFCKAQLFNHYIIHK
jgi:hypothetical protein